MTPGPPQDDLLTRLATRHNELLEGLDRLEKELQRVLANEELIADQKPHQLKLADVDLAAA